MISKGAWPVPPHLPDAVWQGVYLHERPSARFVQENVPAEGVKFHLRLGHDDAFGDDLNQPP